MTDKPIAWMYEDGGYHPTVTLWRLPYIPKRTETPLYGPEALAAKDALIAELEEALAAEDDYWQASRDHACALARQADATRAALSAASERRERARQALETKHG